MANQTVHALSHMWMPVSTIDISVFNWTTLEISELVPGHGEEAVSKGWGLLE